MMVPRSYQYSGPSPTKYSSVSEKTPKGMNAERRPSKSTAKKDEAKKCLPPSKMLTPSPPTPSNPVVIPTRSRISERRKSRETILKDKRKDAGGLHDLSSTPPSMAALLAMTTLPEPGYKARSTNNRKSSTSGSVINDTSFKDAPRRSISSSSPRSWGMLFSPPEISALEGGSFESDVTLGPASSVRSLSTDSMPSLDEDTESLSSISNPATPGAFHSSHFSSGRQKSVSTSMGEECVLNHPLLPQDPKPVIQDDESPNILVPQSTSPSSRTTSFFKSNLTASFRRIRSAAQSFSAFTAPPTQSEDYLARTLLSLDPHLTDERRPSPSTELPGPALRRYLNPPTTHFSPADFHFHSASESPPQVAKAPISASIQLQTYQRRNNGGANNDKASSPPIFTSAQQKAIDAVDGLPQVSGPKQREPRENSDFLRVVVLEMNMRRCGKLKEGEMGRARLWLPARHRMASKGLDEKKDHANIIQDGDEGVKIPHRWAAVTA